ncbi:hypothetical protein WS71_11640 [Burkholderia mayonis]|uniref:Uncharacterized protein n=1 Tax=Burkholderia mayonis TaxID=1385591 RepID=A0A1B4FW68_9BURK|nr:hypothetical protein WS71_11640 [Burkholderia mayonis]KVE50162.1 hypothetical protein WS71_13795 [Burkholderia mayonis]
MVIAFLLPHAGAASRAAQRAPHRESRNARARASDTHAACRRFRRHGGAARRFATIAGRSIRWPDHASITIAPIGFNRTISSRHRGIARRHDAPLTSNARS